VGMGSTSVHTVSDKELGKSRLTNGKYYQVMETTVATPSLKTGVYNNITACICRLINPINFTIAGLFLIINVFTLPCRKISIEIHRWILKTISKTLKR
jgi:hypothetical protein